MARIDLGNSWRRPLVKEYLKLDGKVIYERSYSPFNPEDIVRFVFREFGHLNLELIDGVWSLVARTTWKNLQGQNVERGYVLSPYDLYVESLTRCGITPRKIEPEPKTPEEKLRKYARLGYEFQLRKRWNKHYLYARKWNSEKKKREHKYIGPWNQQLERTAKELGVKITTYEV